MVYSIVAALLHVGATASAIELVFVVVNCANVKVLVQTLTLKNE